MKILLDDRFNLYREFVNDLYFDDRRKTEKISLSEREVKIKKHSVIFLSKKVDISKFRRVYLGFENYTLLSNLIYKVFFNGIYLGRLDDFSNTEFDITDHVKASSRILISVENSDDVDHYLDMSSYLKTEELSLIDDAHLIYSRFDGSIAFNVQCKEGCHISYQLFYDDEKISSFEDDNFKLDTVRNYDDVHPDLYRVDIIARKDEEQEVCSFDVGFIDKEIIDGHFFINNERRYLKGLKLSSSSSSLSDKMILSSYIKEIKENGINLLYLSYRLIDDNIISSLDKLGIFYIVELPGLKDGDDMKDDYQSLISLVKTIIKKVESHPAFLAFYIKKEDDLFYATVSKMINDECKRAFLCSDNDFDFQIQENISKGDNPRIILSYDTDIESVIKKLSLAEDCLGFLLSYDEKVVSSYLKLCSCIKEKNLVHIDNRLSFDKPIYYDNNKLIFISNCDCLKLYINDIDIGFYYSVSNKNNIYFKYLFYVDDLYERYIIKREEEIKKEYSILREYRIKDVASFLNDLFLGKKLSKKELMIKKSLSDKAIKKISKIDTIKICLYKDGNEIKNEIISLDEDYKIKKISGKDLSYYGYKRIDFSLFKDDKQVVYDGFQFSVDGAEQVILKMKIRGENYYSLFFKKGDKEDISISYSDREEILK